MSSTITISRQEYNQLLKTLEKVEQSTDSGLVASYDEETQSLEAYLKEALESLDDALSMIGEWSSNSKGTLKNN